MKAYHCFNFISLLSQSCRLLFSAATPLFRSFTLLCERHLLHREMTFICKQISDVAFSEDLRRVSFRGQISSYFYCKINLLDYKKVQQCAGAFYNVLNPNKYYQPILLFATVGSEAGVLNDASFNTKHIQTFDQLLLV